MTADFTTIETALYTKLITTAGTALWGTKVYVDQADEAHLAAQVVANVPRFPYVVFFLVSGGEENVNPAGSFDVEYQIDCWSTQLSQARQGLTYLNTALHRQELTISGYTNFAMRQRNLIRSVENDAGVQFYRRGAVYRIRGS